MTCKNSNCLSDLQLITTKGKHFNIPDIDLEETGKVKNHSCILNLYLLHYYLQVISLVSTCIFVSIYTPLYSSAHVSAHSSAHAPSTLTSISSSTFSTFSSPIFSSAPNPTYWYGFEHTADLALSPLGKIAGFAIALNFGQTRPLFQSCSV